MKGRQAWGCETLTDFKFMLIWHVLTNRQVDRRLKIVINFRLVDERYWDLDAICVVLDSKIVAQILHDSNIYFLSTYSILLLRLIWIH